MSAEQKPVELLQAQVALYAEAQVEHVHPGREAALLSSLGDISLYTEVVPMSLTYPRTVAHKEFTDNGVVVKEPKGAPTPLFKQKEYADFIRRPQNREVSRNLANMISTYDQLGKTIEDLGILDLNLDHALQHSNFLGHGGSQMAFSFRTDVKGEPKDLVAIIDQDPDRRHGKAKANSRAINLARAKGLAGFEQGVAVSYDPPLVIVEKVQGKSLADLTFEERDAIPESHWEELLANAEKASTRGISIDTNTDNFFYDPSVGFTVIDFRGDSSPKPEENHRNIKGITEIRALVMGSSVIKRN